MTYIPQSPRQLALTTCIVLLQIGIATSADGRISVTETAPHPDEEVLLRETLTEVVREALQPRQFTTEYEWRPFASTAPPDALDRPFDPSRDRRFAAVTVDGRLRIDDVANATGTVIAGDATQSFELSFRRIIWRSGVSDPHQGAAVLFHGIDGVDSFAGLRRIDELVALAAFDEVVRDGNLVTVRFRVPSIDEAETLDREARGAAPPSGPFRFEMVVDLDRRVIVELGRFHATPGDPDAAAAIAGTGGRSARLRVERWMEFEGRAIPERLVRTVVTPRGRSEELFVRTSIEPIDTLEARALLDVAADGWTITDPALGLEFVVGARSLRWAGRTWPLAEPIRAHPGDGLAELIARPAPNDGP